LRARIDGTSVAGPEPQCDAAERRARPGCAREAISIKASN